MDGGREESGGELERGREDFEAKVENWGELETIESSFAKVWRN